VLLEVAGVAAGCKIAKAPIASASRSTRSLFGWGALGHAEFIFKDIHPAHVRQAPLHLRRSSSWASAIAIFARDPFWQLLPLEILRCRESDSTGCGPGVDVGMLYVFALSASRLRRHSGAAGPATTNTASGRLAIQRPIDRLLIPAGLGILGVVISRPLRLERIIFRTGLESASGMPLRIRWGCRGF